MSSSVDSVGRYRKTGNEMTELPKEHNDDDDDCAVDNNRKPRALLVTGLPLATTGRGLHGFLSSGLFPSSFKAPFQTKFDRNQHGHIRGGAATLIFASAEDAAEALLSCSQQDCGNAEAVLLDGVMTSLSSIRVDYAAGRLRDHLFPWLPFALRRQLRLDYVAAFSATDLPTATAMATLTAAVTPRCEERLLTALDATAASGGNVFGFASARQKNRSSSFGLVDAVELDSARFELLKANVAALQAFCDATSAISIHNGCCLEYIADRVAATGNPWDVVFFDPPWGGPSHRDEDSNSVLGLSCSAPSAQAMFMPFGAPSGTADVPLPEVVLACLAARVASVVALKLPRSNAGDRTVFEIVHRCCEENTVLWAADDARERPFPIRACFGASTQLLCVVANHSTDGWRNVELFKLIAKVKRWHARDDVDEHNPCYYDYEKQRWIPIKKWIPRPEDRDAFRLLSASDF
jgi:hypothetical protein